MSPAPEVVGRLGDGSPGPAGYAANPTPCVGAIVGRYVEPVGPTVQGNYLDGSIVGTSGRRYRQGGGIAVVTQNLPDAPNRAWAPSPALSPGETYTYSTEGRLAR